MRRTLGVLAVVVALVLGVTACGGKDEASTTTAPNSITLPPVTGPDGSVVAGDAVTRYCDKVDELAELVANGRNGAGDYDAQLRKVSDELKELSTEAAKSLSTNAAAAKKFADCSLTASKKIAESFQPG